MTAPNIAPLPDWAACFHTKDRNAIRAYALAAYQAGRDAGLRESIAALHEFKSRIPQSGYSYAASSDRCDGELIGVEGCIDAVEALKSNSEGGG